MKRNELKYLVAGLLLSMSVLSCGSDDESYDVTVCKENLAYFPATAAKATQTVITVTPAGAIGNVGKQSVLFQRPVSQNTTVIVVADEKLASQYNEQNATDYPILPSSVIDYTFASATVEKGQAESADELSVRLTVNALSQLSEPCYLAAFRMSDVKGEGQPSTNRNVFYSLVSTNIQDRLHVLAGDAVSYSIFSTPAGSFGEVLFDQPYTFSGELNNKATISLTQDNTLVAQYNTDHGTQAQALPDGVLEIGNAVVTVDNGQSTSDAHFRISIPEANLSKLSGSHYVVPFTISATTEGGQTVVDAGVFYMVLNVEWRLSNGDALTSDLKGTIIPLETMKTWTVSGGVDFNHVTDDVRSTTWKSGTYVIDMLTSQKITGLKLLTRYAKANFTKGVRLELSEDADTWMDAGTLTTMPRDNAEFDYCYYVLYGGVSARYLRITFGASAMSELRVYAE